MIPAIILNLLFISNAYSPGTGFGFFGDHGLSLSAAD
jgi:hypothetical protein